MPLALNNNKGSVHFDVTKPVQVYFDDIMKKYGYNTQTLSQCRFDYESKSQRRFDYESIVFESALKCMDLKSYHQCHVDCEYMIRKYSESSYDISFIRVHRRGSRAYTISRSTFRCTNYLESKLKLDKVKIKYFNTPHKWTHIRDYRVFY